VDTAQARAEAALRRDATLEAVAFAAQRFLEDPAWDRSVSQVLRRLGEATAVSRVYLYANVHDGPELQTMLRAQWIDDDLEPAVEVGATLGFRGLERWTTVLGRGDVLHGAVATFPEAERAVLRTHAIRSILLAPISVDGAWWGYVGFDDCIDDRVWTQVEIDALRAAAGTLGAAIARQRSEERVREAEARYRSLVEHVPAITYLDREDLEAGTWPTVYLSPQIETILGYSLEDWTHDPTLWSHLIHPDDRDLALEADAEHYRTGAPLHSEYRLVTRDGREVWVRDEATIVVDEDGRRLSQGVLIDVTESKVAEQRLREAEARYRSIVERTPAVTYQERADDAAYEATSAVIYMSPQIERILGYPADRWAAFPGFWATIIHPDDLERVSVESDRTAGTGEPYSQEYRLIATDGRTVWFRDEAVLIRDERGQPTMWQGVMVDITDRKQVEEQVHATERRLRDLVENIPAVTYREALDGNPEDFYISPQVQSLFGYSQQEWTWTPAFWMDRVHPDDVARVSALDRETNERGVPFSAEYRLRRADGSYVWVSDQASLIGADGEQPFWQGFLLDISERRQAEEAVAVAEVRFRALVEQVPVIIYTQEIDPSDPSVSKTTYISPRQEDILGYTAEESLATGDLWTRMLHPDDRDRVLATDAEGNRSGEDFVMEYRMIARDGRVVWLHDEAKVIRDASGAPRFWQGFMFDVTERRLAEERLEHALSVEREAGQRLRALDEMKNTFLQAVSHDLRTPLAAILGLAITLERAEIDLPPEETRDLANRIATNARKLDRMVTDLLDLDRLARGIVQPKRHPTDLADLVRRIVEGSDLASDGRLRLELEEVVVNVDASKVERIVENLLANTARHTPAGTAVLLRVGRADGGGLIVVEDQGPGVPEELRETIFEPFQQGPDAPEHSPGVGVGLTLVRRFAELHGGRAWVEDRRGGGASFRVFLPDAAATGAEFGSAG
jgi:PAS domain S-box-containing protein